MIKTKENAIVYLKNLDTYGIVDSKDGDFFRVDTVTETMEESQVVPIHKRDVGFF